MKYVTETLISLIKVGYAIYGYQYQYDQILGKRESQTRQAFNFAVI